jgi:hypothetical protein
VIGGHRIQYDKKLAADVTFLANIGKNFERGAI